MLSNSLLLAVTRPLLHAVLLFSSVPQSPIMAWNIFALPMPLLLVAGDRALVVCGMALGLIYMSARTIARAL